jgi:DNA-binding MarR family transcriptional regulator
VTTADKLPHPPPPPTRWYDAFVGEQPEQLRLEAWRAFLVAHARLTEVLERELREARDLPLTWYDVLVQLNEQGGSLRMKELAGALLLSKSGLTRLIDRMSEANLVQRAADPGDRRGVTVLMTPTGRRALVEAAPVHLRGVQEHFAAHLNPDEAAVLRDALTRIASDIRP